MRRLWTRFKFLVGIVAGFFIALWLAVAARRDDDGRGRGGGTHNGQGRPDDGRRRPRRGGF